ncbi:hypothetical protein D3C87_1540070 [compost metagenome]
MKPFRATCASILQSTLLPKPNQKLRQLQQSVLRQRKTPDIFHEPILQNQAGTEDALASHLKSFDSVGLFGKQEWGEYASLRLRWTCQHELSFRVECVSPK